MEKTLNQTMKQENPLTELAAKKNREKERKDLEERARAIEENDSKSTGIVRFLAVTGILSAAAFVLQYIEIAVPFMPSFIKFDFSDLPALLGSFALGPVSGIVIELIKNLLHSAVSQSFGIGEISNFILGAVFVAVAGLIYKRKKTRTGALIGAFAGAAAMALISLPANIFLVYPVYYNFMPKEVVLKMYQAIIPSVHSMNQALLLFNVPFTFVKGIISVMITMLIYKPLSPVLHGRRG
ncbi:ECF transporter S component [Lachnospiraceae bacterium YH-ros2228]